MHFCVLKMLLLLRFKRTRVIAFNLVQTFARTSLLLQQTSLTALVAKQPCRLARLKRNIKKFTNGSNLVCKYPRNIKTSIQPTNLHRQKFFRATSHSLQLSNSVVLAELFEQLCCCGPHAGRRSPHCYRPHPHEMAERHEAR